jgi:uncharacterized protein YhbP (UPF0306 family)
MNSVRLTGVAAWNAAGEPAEVHGLSERRVRQAVFRVLKSNVLGAMATVAPDGRAHIHTCYFSYTQALELFFLSHPRSQHCRNLLANPSTAVAVFSSSQLWAGPDRGLQLFGTCAEAAGAGAARCYAARFPDYATEQTPPEYRLYGVTVHSLKILDEREFGDAVFVCAQLSRG